MTVALASRHNIVLDDRGVRTASADMRIASRLLTALNWCATQPHCKGNLGIPRAKMPQIKGQFTRQFQQYLADAGIRVRADTVPAKNLRATQREIMPSVIEMVIENNFHRQDDRPVWASADNYILDGHHRWAALLVEEPDAPMRLMKIMAPIHEVLALAHAFPFVQYSNRKADIALRLACRWVQEH